MGSFRHFRYGSGELYEKLAAIEDELEGIAVGDERVSSIERRLRLMQIEQDFSSASSIIVGGYSMSLTMLAVSFVFEEPAMRAMSLSEGSTKDRRCYSRRRLHKVED